MIRLGFHYSYNDVLLLQQQVSRPHLLLLTRHWRHRRRRTSRDVNRYYWRCCYYVTSGGSTSNKRWTTSSSGDRIAGNNLGAGVAWQRDDGGRVATHQSTSQVDTDEQNDGSLDSSWYLCRCLPRPTSGIQFHHSWYPPTSTAILSQIDRISVSVEITSSFPIKWPILTSFWLRPLHFDYISLFRRLTFSSVCRRRLFNAIVCLMYTVCQKTKHLIANHNSENCRPIFIFSAIPDH